MMDGDIMMPALDDNMEGAALEHEVKLWPETAPGEYEVPYTVHPNITAAQRMTIFYVMEFFERGSNIVFRPRRDGETAYVKIVPGGQCSSHLGVQHPVYLTLDNNCYTPGIIMHEFMHSLGFIHEHQRPERDNYIVYGRNVTLPKSDKVNHGVQTDAELVTPYNVYSVMHYGVSQPDKNGNVGGFVARDPELQKKMSEFSHHLSLSSCDWHALNTKYPGKKPIPKCDPWAPPDFKIMPTLSLRTYTQETDWLERYCFGLAMGIPSRECALAGFREFPPLPWLDELTHLKAVQVSDIVRIGFCKDFVATEPAKMDTITCVRSCKYVCRENTKMTLPDCMKTQFPACAKQTP